MREYEVVLSYTFRVRTESWDQAKELGHKATLRLPNTIEHPQRPDRRPELDIDLGGGYEVEAR